MITDVCLQLPLPQTLCWSLSPLSVALSRGASYLLVLVLHCFPIATIQVP